MVDERAFFSYMLNIYLETFATILICKLNPRYFIVEM